METIIKFKMKVGEKTYLLFIDCDTNVVDVTLLKGKFVSVFCHNVSINEELSSKDYKEAFDFSNDGDYHFLVEIKKDFMKYLVYSDLNELKKPNVILVEVEQGASSLLYLLLILDAPMLIVEMVNKYR